MSISNKDLIQKANQRLELMHGTEKTQIEEAIWMLKNQGETRSQISDSQYQKLMQIDRQELSPGETSKIQIDVLGQELAEAGLISESDLDSNADLEDALETIINNLKDEKEAVKDARQLLISYFDTTQEEKPKFLADMEQQVKWMSEEIEAEANPEPESETFNFGSTKAESLYTKEEAEEQDRKDREYWNKHSGSNNYQLDFQEVKKETPKEKSISIKNEILALKIEEQQLKNEALKVKIREQNAKYNKVNTVKPKLSTGKLLMWFFAIFVFPPSIFLFLIFYFPKQLRWVLKTYVMFLAWIGEITIQLLHLTLVSFIKVLHQAFPKTQKIIILK